MMWQVDVCGKNGMTGVIRVLLLTRRISTRVYHPAFNICQLFSLITQQDDTLARLWPSCHQSPTKS